MVLEQLLLHDEIDTTRPTLLYQRDQHRIYWLGFNEETVFRCNTYLIADGDEAIVVDPGGRGSMAMLARRIEQVIPVSQVVALIISHQDPDIAGCLGEWLEQLPDVAIMTSPRTLVLLPYYGIEDFQVHDIEQQPEYVFRSGSRLRFFPAPFLHSPMAFVTLDDDSGFMFTSDIFAAIDADWHLVVKDFEYHASKMDLFHTEYMACNKATAGFVESIEDLPIKAFLPQHGSIIPESYVRRAMDYLTQLQCGLDITYPHL